MAVISFQHVVADEIQSKIKNILQVKWTNEEVVCFFSSLTFEYVVAGKYFFVPSRDDPGSRYATGEEHGAQLTD